MLRGRMLARIGARFDELLSHRVFDLVATMPLKGARQAESMQPIRDLDTIRGFLASLGRRPCSTCPSCRSSSSAAS